MNLVFLAFANNEVEPLPSLSAEDDQIYHLLARRAKDGHFFIHRDSHTTVPKILDQLLLYKDQLTVFHFSGHAGRDLLLLEDGQANARGIMEILKQCPKLKLVLLNGCSTQGQVAQLLELDTHPIIIATSAPVGDMEATEFSTRFYQALAEDYETVEEAFNWGIAAAQTVSNHTITVEKRSMGRQALLEEPIWGIFYRSELNLGWRLPEFQMAYLPQQFEPNTILIKHLIRTYSSYNQEVGAIFQDEKNGIQRSLLDKREAILKCLPHPISEQLRKLIVREQAGSTHIFYYHLGHNRLKQMATTYYTIIELLAFILLAQLWDELLKNKDFKVKIASGLLGEITHFFSLRRRERPLYNWIPLIQELQKVLHSNEVPFFVKELAEANFFNGNSEFEVSCSFMESLKKRMTDLKRAEFDGAEAQRLCIIAEEKLAIILGQMGFLAKYVLASVKNIDVIKYRHIDTPQFKHKVVRLVQRFVGLAEEHQVRDNYMDTASVILIPDDSTDERFLNLSPFVIDENAFIEKSNISKLYYFDRYEKEADAYTYKHVYKPEDIPLVVRQEMHFSIIKTQFKAFLNLISDQSIQ